MSKMMPQLPSSPLFNLIRSEDAELSADARWFLGNIILAPVEKFGKCSLIAEAKSLLFILDKTSFNDHLKQLSKKVAEATKSVLNQEEGLALEIVESILALLEEYNDGGSLSGLRKSIRSMLISRIWQEYKTFKHLINNQTRKV